MGGIGYVWNEVKNWHKETAARFDDPFSFNGAANIVLGGAPFATDITWRAIRRTLVPDMRTNREAQIQSASNARNIVYGRTRVGNTIAYAESCGSKNEYLHLICMHAAHEIDGYEEIYFDDKLVASATAETVDGTYYAAWAIRAPFTGHAVIERFDGSQTTACASLVAASAGGWTTDHKLLGIAYTHVTLTYDEGVYPAGVPTVKAVIRGKRILDTRTGLIAWSCNPAMCIRDYKLIPEDFGGAGCDTSELNETAIHTAADICDELVHSNQVPGWAVGKKTWWADAARIFASIEEPRYTLNGQIVLDGAPTDFVKSMLSAMAGESVYSEGLWEDYAGAPSATVATIDESWLNGGLSFQVGTSKNGKNNTVKGKYTNSNDYWADTEFPEVPVGLSTPPNASYWSFVAAPSVYVASQTYLINSYVTWAGLVYKSFNAVPINKTPPDSGYWVLVEVHDNSVQYPPAHVVQRGGSVYTSTGIVPVSNQYIADDGGEVLAANIVLPFTITSSEAQRLAKIALEESRRGFALTYPCNHKAFKLKPHDVVTVNNDLLGISGKLFRVGDWEFAMMGGTNLSLIEYDGAIYDWVPGDSTPLVSPTITNLPDPWTVAAPTGLSLSTRVYDSNASAASRVDLIITWVSGQASGTIYQIQYKPLDSGMIGYNEWQDYGRISDTTCIIGSLASGNYSIQVRALNALGASSGWVSASVFIPNTDDYVPNITGLEIFGQGNNASFVGKDIKLRWNKVSPRANDIADGAAAPMKYPGWFRYYELKLFSGDRLLRTEYLQNESFNYDFEKNHSDNYGSPARSVTVEVRAVATWGTSSSMPARITAVNPAPPVVGLTLAMDFKGFSVNIQPSSEPDISGYLIYASTVNGFTPSEAYLINRGPETYFRHYASGTWYIKVAAFDTYGEDALNYSPQYAITVSDQQVVPDDLYGSLRTDFLVQESIFYFGDDGVTPTPGTEDTLYWTAGAIIRGVDTFTLATDDIPAAADKWIIATLSAGVATLSTAVYSAGIPTLTAEQIIICFTSATPNDVGNYLCYVRQANNVQMEGAVIRNLSATKIESGILNAGLISAGTIQTGQSGDPSVLVLGNDANPNIIISAANDGSATVAEFYSNGADSGSASSAVNGLSIYGYGARFGQGHFVGSVWDDSGKAPLLIAPSHSTDAPTHSADIGGVWVTSDGKPYLNIGTTSWNPFVMGSPQTTRVTYTNSDASSGWYISGVSIEMCTGGFRIVETRTYYV